MDSDSGCSTSVAYKTKDQEIHIAILNLNKRLDEEPKENTSLKCLARQLRHIEHINRTYKSKIKALEKELRNSKRKLSAKQHTCRMSIKAKNSNAICLQRHLLKLGVLSPNESVELSSTGIPVNQHSNSGDCDSDLTIHNGSEGKELRQDNSYLDVQRPIDADENNFEESYGGGSANEMNQAQDSNSDGNIWNEIDLYSQENDNDYDAQWFIDQLAISLEAYN